MLSRLDVANSLLSIISLRETVESLLHDGQALFQLLVGDHQRHERSNDITVVTTGEDYEPFFVTEFDKRLGFRGGRFLGYPVADKLEGQHGTPPAHIPHDL